MDLTDYSFELWLIIIVIIDSFRISSTFDFFTFTTYLSIAVFLKMYPYGKKRKILRNISTQVSETKSNKNISTQTSTNNTVTTGTQTMEQLKEEKLEKQTQTDEISLKTVAIQTINQVPTLNIEREIQTDSLYFKTIGTQTVIDTQDKQIQSVAKNTISVSTQTESIPTTSDDHYKEEQKIDKILFEEDLKETEETHNLTNYNFRDNSQNVIGEGNTYFNLSSLSVLPSSSIQNRKEKKKNGWRRFKKAMKRISHPFKSHKNDQ